MWNFDDVDMIPGYGSDYSLFILKLIFGKNIKCKMFWKLNCALLKEKSYVEEINKVIDETICEYSTEHYDTETISKISLTEIELTVSELIITDFLLMKIRPKTIAYATIRKKRTLEKQKGLVKEISDLEKKENKQEKDLKLLQEKK